MQIQNIKIADLQPYANNPRNNDKAVDKLAESIKEFGFKVPVIIDRNNEIVAGHTRVKAATKLGLTEVPCLIADDLTPDQIKAFRLVENKSQEWAEWNMEMLAAELMEIKLDLERFDFTPAENVAKDYTAHPTLRDRFIVPPFSVLDARQGDWQKRKKKWNEIISSGEGRNVGLLGMGLYDLAQKMNSKTLTGTSLFDPVLAEILLHWYSPKGGKVIDPFAGGSVRGLISSFVGREYHGVDLSQDQIEANKENFEKVKNNTDVFGQPLKKPNWKCGDSTDIDKHIKEDKFDMLLTCPPYFDLEQYSDDPRDISNMTYEEFLQTYETILHKAIAKVKDNGFIAIVVGEVRDKNGNYRNFIGDTIEACRRAGVNYYSEIVLVTMLGSLPIRIKRQFEATRKVGNTHQKALIFFKSNGDEAALKEYMESFSDTRVVHPMKQSILVFLKGKPVRPADIEKYGFDIF